MLANYTYDRQAIQLTRAKKAKTNNTKVQTNKDVERLITRLQQDEQAALKVFIDAGESEDKNQYM